MKFSVKNLFPHRQMQFQAVEEDDDDLSNLIKRDPETHDNVWKLTEDIDGAKLAAFWDDAMKDLSTGSEKNQQSF